MMYYIYRRLRTTMFFLSLPIMYSIITNNLSLHLIFGSVGLALVSLFGDFYNDVCDYAEDLKNKRFEKLTMVFGIDNVIMLYKIVFIVAIAFLIFSNLYILLLGLYASIITFLYSFPKVRIKEFYNVYKFMLMGSPFLLLPFILDLSFGRTFSLSTIFFSLFLFFEVTYILIQKDSTDKKDRINFFKKFGWKRASVLCATSAFLASTFLAFFVNNLFLLAIWILNLSSKTINNFIIWKKIVERKMRWRLILIEFITPYLFCIGWFL